MKNNPCISKGKGIMTLDKLAGMMANGFSNLEEKLTNKIDGVEDRLSTRIDSLENRIDTLEDSMLQKFSGLENRIDDLAEGKATREEVKIINTRLTRVEKKLATQ